MSAHADHAAPAAARPLSVLELTLFTIFVFGFAFDFRSLEPGGHWIHQVYLWTSMLSFIALFLALLSRKARPEVYEMGRLMPVLGVLLLSHALFGALYSGVDLGNFARLQHRYVLFFQGVVLIYMMGRAGLELRPAITLVFASALVGLAWSNYHTLVVQDMIVGQARYRLAPIFTICVLGVSVAAIYNGRLLYVLPLVAALYAIQLSATRSFLLAIGALYLMIHVYALAGAERRRLIALCLVDFVIVALALHLYRTGFFDIWVQRFVLNETGGGDASVLARLAEYKSQWDYLNASWSNTIFGAGLGSSYVRDLGVMRLAILSHHLDLDEVRTFEFGHSLWIYSAYYGGILGGWILPLIFLATLVRSVWNVFRSHRNRDWRRYLTDMQVSAITAQAALIGLFAHPFSARLFAIQFGLLAAIAFVYPRGRDRPGREARKREARRVESGAFT